jgi:ATP-binding cassette subfamily B protein/subfamily B ATP-binding cassette protein MsbA
MGGGAGGGNYKIKHAKKKLFAEYRVMLRGYYGPVAGLLTLAFIGSLLSFVMPASLKLLLDYVAKGKSLREVPWFAGVRDALPPTAYGSLVLISICLIIAAATSIALDWLRLLAQQRINYRMAGSLRLRLHRHLTQLPLSQLADYKTGGIVSRIMGDTDQVVGGVQNALVNPINAIFRITLTIAAIVAASWKLALVAAVLVPPIVAIHFFIFRRLRPMWRNIQDDRSTLSGKLTDMYGGIRVVRSFRRERWEWKEFNAGQDTMIRKHPGPTAEYRVEYVWPGDRSRHRVVWRHPGAAIFADWRHAGHGGRHADRLPDADSSAYQPDHGHDRLVPEPSAEPGRPRPRRRCPGAAQGHARRPQR